MLALRVLVTIGVAVPEGAARPANVESPCWALGQPGDCSAECASGDHRSSDADNVFGW